MEDVVIIGAGLSGLATAVGLHRKGIRSLVLESSDSLRAVGFAFTVWTNAWRALDALGVGDSLRPQHIRIEGMVATSLTSGATLTKLPFNTQGKRGEHEIRCVRRNMLLGALEKEVPHGTIRYSSKVVSIEEDGNLKLLQLADGSTIKTKVVIGCDGVNSVVAKWLGLRTPSFTGRSASRGLAEFPDGHGFKPEFLQFIGKGYRFGMLPCDERSIYWFFTWIPSPKDNGVEEDGEKMREFVLSKLRLGRGVPHSIEQVVERSEMGGAGVVSSPLRFRWPLDLLWGSRISRGNVCVAGDAFHPMTPDLGQGACCALEDAVVLARCLGAALVNSGADEGKMVKEALEKYSEERRWRGFELISIGYLLGAIQQSDGAIMGFLRDNIVVKFLQEIYLKRGADFDCGNL